MPHLSDDAASALAHDIAASSSDIGSSPLSPDSSNPRAVRSISELSTSTARSDAETTVISGLGDDSVMFPFSAKMVADSCDLLRSQMEVAGDRDLVRMLTGIPDWLFQRWMFSHTTRTFLGPSQPLLELLVHPSLALPKALFATPLGAPMSLAFARILTTILLPHGRFLDLLAWAVAAEVAATDTVTTLFRGNSSASRLLTALASLVGQEYLNTNLAWIVHELCDPARDLELDPAKLDSAAIGNAASPDVVLAAHAQAVIDYGHAVFTRLAAAVSAMPPLMRAVATIVHTAVEAKFEGAGNFAIGSFLFLRFICPALASPARYGLIGLAPSQRARRNLVVLSQMLQKLASGVTTAAAKHPHLGCYDEFVASHLDMRDAFFAAVLRDAPAAPNDLRSGITAADVETALDRIAAPLAQHLELLLDACGSVLWVDSNTFSGAANVLVHLANVLAGPPERAALPVPALVNLFARVLFVVGGPRLYLALHDVVASTSAQADALARAYVRLGLASEHAEPFVAALTGEWINRQLESNSPETRADPASGGALPGRKATLRTRCASIREFSSFMRNSPPSRILSVYFELVTVDVLRTELLPVLAPVGASCKVLDTSALANEASPKARALVVSVHRLLSALIVALGHAARALPPRFHDLCRALDAAVIMPNYETPEPTPEGRATLVLLSKLISHLAEGTSFSNYDPLAPLNALLSKVRPDVSDLLAALHGFGLDRSAVATPSKVFISARDKRSAIACITSLVEHHPELVSDHVDDTGMLAPLIETVEYNVAQRIYTVMAARALHTRAGRPTAATL
ncbi:uncharacterized protein AMSG_00039 [Thecamonas trahens ATCC 50062]|uniref:Ras-GAP domain-containing protein n=1 Tax=Thecamonas trahens ATCC 50062 TaxID=461836 RepID=A0A0L0D123_THETB|nr:hypothetical protein AMSG_00039 [Thecamonas trahens ATCC 50062]KNC45926.1 hypothetical protein AMSG_00039 [Thecamonas trahens ATCC 50062]|eukprot:XP_013762909.1 hypothetical protein AMSG_00039 [Thecamonas trahens ATCC 50062]